MTQEQLQPFCAKADDRPNLAQPFSQGRFTFATDGKILVRVPRIPDVPEQAEPANVNALFDTALKPTVFVPITGAYEVQPPETEPCKECNGYGKLDTCKTCKGEGDTECQECGNIEKCPDCKGRGASFSKDGKEDCDECHGTGRKLLTQYADIGGNRYNAAFLELINTLPNCKIGKVEFKNSTHMPFRFTGGDGLIMPIFLTCREGRRSHWS